MSRGFYSIVILISTALVYSAYCSESDLAKDLLAQLAAQAKTFSADVEFIRGRGARPIRMKWYQRTRLDGQVDLRIQLGEHGDSPFFLKRDDGLWSINNHLAIHMAHLSTLQQYKSQYLAGLDMQTNDDEGDTFSVSEISTNDTVYYVVTQDISEHKKQILRESLNTPQVKEALSKYSHIEIPTMSEKRYVLNKTDNTLEQYSEYADNGALLLQANFSKFHSDTSLPDELFQVPKGIRQVTTQSIEDYQSIIGLNTASIKLDTPSHRRMRLIIITVLALGCSIP